MPKGYRLMPWGDYEGRAIRELPDGYLRGLLHRGFEGTRHPRLLRSLELEMQRRRRG